MSAWLELVLDTHAPRLTWGAVGGTVAGELLQVAYTVDEPGVSSATLQLADGRRLNMTVQPDRLELYLPPDLPNGPATLVAQLVDDVGNATTAQLVVELTGGTGYVPSGVLGRGAAPMPTSGPRPRRPGGKKVTARTAARAASTAHVATRHGVRTRAALRTGARTAANLATTATPSSALSAYRVRSASQGARASASVRSGGVAVTRRDGPELEALLLDLL